MLALPLDKSINQGGACMHYMNSEDILPKELVEELQNYLQGGYLYIPVKKEEKKSWGELSGYKETLAKRNAKIKKQFQSGAAIATLAKDYHLSIHSIKKIIYSKPT